MKKLIALALVTSSAAFAQVSSEMNSLINQGQQALTHPESIASTSQKIQSFLSDPKNKSLDLKALSQIQTRLILFSRLAEDLGSSQCENDSTKKSIRGKEILSHSLKIPAQECSEVGPGLLLEHKNISSLITEMKLIDENSYSGAYTISESGELIFPWQVSKDEHEKHLWKFTLANVGKEAHAFDPHSPENNRQLADELYHQSLKDTFKTFMYLKTAYGSEKINPQKVAQSFCTEKRSFFSRLTSSKKAAHCPAAIEKFAVKLAAELEVSKAPKSFETGVKKVNDQVAGLNKVIERIKKNTKLIYGVQGKAETRYVKEAHFIDQKQAMHDYAEYKKLHHQMVNSGSGLFVATSELNEKLGMRPLHPKNFLTLHPSINKSQFKNAVDEAKDHTFDHGQELISIYHSKDPVTDQVKNLLSLNPAAAARVLVKRPELAKTVCRGLKGISIDELTDRQLRLMSTWGGVIVGGVVAATGVGAIPMAVIGMVAATPDLAMSFKHFQEASDQRDAAFAESNGDKAGKQTEKYSQAQDELAIAGVLTGAGILYDVNQALKVGRMAMKPGVLSIMENAMASTPERLASAQKILGTKLSGPQRNAILEAHMIGQGKGVYQYTTQDLLAKSRVLDKAGFDQKQIRLLMESGITGEPSVGRNLSSLELKPYLRELDTTSEKVLALNKADQLTKIEELGSIKVDFTTLRNPSTRTTSELIDRPIRLLANTIKQSSDPEVQMAAFKAMKKSMSSVSGAESYSSSYTKKMADEYYNDIYLNTDMPDEIRRLAQLEANLATNQNAEYLTAAALKEKNAFLAEQAAAKALAKTEKINAFKDADAETKRFLNSTGLDIFDYVRDGKYNFVEIVNGEGLVKPAGVETMVGRETVVMIKTEGQYFKIKGTTIREGKMDFDIRDLNGNIHHISPFEVSVEMIEIR